jgi:hypothetical protein
MHLLRMIGVPPPGRRPSEGRAMTDKAIPIFPSRDLDVAASSLGRIGFRETARYRGYTVLERGTIELHYAANRDHDPFTEARTAYVGSTTSRRCTRTCSTPVSSVGVR